MLGWKKKILVIKKLPKTCNHKLPEQSKCFHQDNSDTTANAIKGHKHIKFG
jgi:hypothetical protein